MIGDSWTDVTGFGFGRSYFERVLGEHGCKVSSVCIAIPGTTASMWSLPAALTALTAAVKAYKPDYVWMTLGGNDALSEMPSCARTGKSADECALQLTSQFRPQLAAIVDTINDAAPNARVTGFGYDTMFGGVGCSLITHDLFPQCWKDGESGNSCFNREFLQIQAGWEDVASNRSFVEAVSILGATQVAGGDPKASTDPNDRHINMDEMGPAKYWPTSMECFHPGTGTGDDKIAGAVYPDVGAHVVMEEFYKVYWSKQQDVCAADVTV